MTTPISWLDVEHDLRRALHNSGRSEVVIELMLDELRRACLPPTLDAEFSALREFVDFVNRQVGVYCDRLAGFQR